MTRDNMEPIEAELEAERTCTLALLKLAPQHRDALMTSIQLRFQRHDLEAMLEAEQEAEQETANEFPRSEFTAKQNAEFDAAERRDALNDADHEPEIVEQRA